MMKKTPAKKRRTKKQVRKFPTLYVVLISIFVISITMFGISRIKKTITFRDTNAYRKLTLGELLDGIMRMDENSQLAISPEQARKILSHLVLIKEHLDDREKMEKLTGKTSQKIEKTLDSKQMDYITSNFEPVPPNFLKLYMKDVIIFLKARTVKHEKENGK
ncbi:MAG: hypothetical protein K8T10_03580 [Candidatus Eremiobacteraeota bacterium]|nr:hypothetical protein [Candidatus Eremiobacteraeota bacterium]